MPSFAYIFLCLLTLLLFLDNRLIALYMKIDKMQTWLILIHNDLLFNDRRKSCNIIKKETLARCFPVNFAKFLGTAFL